MAHLMVDAIDDKLITTVSPKAYNFLREETKYTKIIITDDMEMKAIADRYSIEEAALLAIDAGADMLLYRFPEDAMRANSALKEALKNKKLEKQKYFQKINRVEECKKEYFKEYRPIYVPKITSAFNRPDAKKLIDQIMENKLKNSRKTT
jgi:beta-N-acetylhexosaminidase